MSMKLGKLLQKPELLFICIASVFGLISVFTMPILSAPDENQHFQVEYGIFSSYTHTEDKKLFLSKDVTLTEKSILTSTTDNTYNKYQKINHQVEKDGFEVNSNGYTFDGKTKVSVFDIMHLPQALGILVGRAVYPSIWTMVIFGRLFSLLTYVVLVYFIIKNIKHGKWVLISIACLPMIIQQAASLSYDSINTVAIFAWFAFVVNLFVQKSYISRKQFLLGAILACFLIVTKINNVLLLLLLFAIDSNKLLGIKTYKKIHSSKHWKTVKSLLFVVAFALGFVALYLMFNRLLNGEEFHPHRLGSVLLNTYLWGNLNLIDTTVIGVVGQFSNFYYHLPVWATTGAFIMVATSMFYEKIPGVSKKFAIISGSLFFGMVLLISIGMYYGWAIKPFRLGPSADITDGIQGRYFTPFLILLFPAVAYLQKYIKIATKNKEIVPIIVSSSSIILLLIYTVQTWHFFWK